MIAEETYTDWMQREIESWEVKKLTDPHVLYEHLKSKAASFGIDPETAAKIIVKELEI